MFNKHEGKISYEKGQWDYVKMKGEEVESLRVHLWRPIYHFMVAKKWETTDKVAYQWHVN